MQDGKRGIKKSEAGVGQVMLALRVYPYGIPIVSRW